MIVFSRCAFTCNLEQTACVRRAMNLTPTEKAQRIAALETRLRIEGFAYDCLAVAAPYLNDEDKSRWKAGDALKFLQSEIDPNFLTGRSVAISPQVPDAENPTGEDYEKLDWSTPVSEPDVNLRTLIKHWNIMGQLLHLDINTKQFDVEGARRRINAANKFCDTLTTGVIVIKSDIRLEERRCVKGHITKRNAARLKSGQIIPCMDVQCKSVFIVECIDPLVWNEFGLDIKCDLCKAENRYQPGPLIDLSYWEKASVPCLTEGCDNLIEVRWVLSRAAGN